ncbi:MAG: bifunctional diaminohydroxyphosphoribosylaminopyrimidine deaminase/5-amino-6-(5-phosphoribosylamino)uracil reductase RibD [Candidatus Puniceispirillaceae bacterium]
MTDTTPGPSPADDRRWMRVAIAEARRAEGRTAPNPPVGCAIVSADGRLLASGHTARGGRPHAESRALEMAGAAARGATAYVTLEPCAHHGQTGPCADALVEAGIARVVVALRDPDERVNGRGIDRLAEHGIVLTIGVEAELARRVMAGFLARTTRSRPFVTLKTATSLDGMIALADGAKRWITGPLMRNYVHLQRSRSDGLLSAVGTVLADDPEFTCRNPGLGGDSPHRFILDGALRTPVTARLFQSVGNVGLTFFCREDADPDAMAAFRGAGAELLPVKAGADGMLSLAAVMAAIAKAGIGSLMIEGGGKLAASLLREGMVDRILWTSSQHLIGADGIPSVSDLATRELPPQASFHVIAEGGFGPDRFLMLERPQEID